MLLLQPLSLLLPWESCLGLLSVAARGKVKGADKYVLESVWLQSQNLSMKVPGTFLAGNQSVGWDLTT